VISSPWAKLISREHAEHQRQADRDERIQRAEREPVDQCLAEVHPK